MNSVTIRIRKARYDMLVNAIAALLSSYDAAQPPTDEFEIETLESVTRFEEFDILRDFALRLGDVRPVDGAGDEEVLEVAVHAHHLIALVAAFPDVAAVADFPESDLRVIVEGLCYAYLVSLTGMSNHHRA